MTAPAFVHLRVHSEYSLVDGLIKVKDLIKRVQAAGMPAVAITDQSNLFALVRFYSACQNAGVKPIAGCDLWLAGRSEDEEPSRVTLLVQDPVGYRNLTELVSRSFLEGQRQQRALIHHDWLAAHAEGLIALMGGRDGEVGRLVLADRAEEAAALLTEWQARFPDRFYLEVQRTGRPGEDAWVHAAVALAAAHDCPVVATNEVCFLDAEDFEAHETRVCIHEGRVLGDPRRPRRHSEQQYLRSPEEMAELFEDLPEALENTVEIARRCSMELKLDTYFLPDYPIPPGETEASFFEAEARAGLERRLARILDPAADDYAARRKTYEDRLAFELGIILQMAYQGYFLIVAEFIRWAKQHGIPVGPGRGSGAGSLVAYALDITDLDPLEYDLLFERFLNPERVSMPDFDVDFCMEGRDRVIAHVADLYGQEAVSQIVTFGTMAAKAVVRDVARVQGKPYGLADKLSKLIPFEVGMTLSKAMAQEEALASFVAENEEVGEIMEMAFKLEGLVRNIGKHAGGVVIAPGRLTDFVPLVADDSGAVMTQFDKDDVERAGLVKFDFLGLRTLTIIDWAVETINRERTERNEPPLAIADLPLGDPDVFALLRKAETTAVFQLESRGMKDLIRRLQPDSFEDMIALVALFRPGPLQSGMVDDFIDRKHGRASVTYPHPDLEPILENTYGVILYQEQVMQIAQVLADYSLGQADLLRRAMGKKKPEEMAKQRQLFTDGAAARGIDAATATYIFDLMEKFAGYGFNKSHSAAYALVSYQTAWLKAHHPAAFMAAVMSADMQHTDKIVTFIDECRQMGLEILPPDVNRGQYRFTVTPEGEVVYGLGAIKGVGEGPIEMLVAARAEGPFSDLFDLCRRVDARRLNKRVIEALIRAGALDSIAPKGLDGEAHRAALLQGIDEALRSAEQAARNAEIGMGDLFGEPGAAVLDAPCSGYDGVRPLTPQQRLQGEKETLGLYLTGHPIESYEEEIRSFAPVKLCDLRPERHTQLVVGMIVDQRIIRTKRGDPIAFVTLDDRSARIEVAVFADLLEANREKLTRDALVVFEGEVAVDDYSGGTRVRAQAVYSLTEARLRFADAVDIRLSAERVTPGFAEQLRRILTPYVGQGCPVAVNYARCDAEARLRLGEAWRVEPCDDLLQRLKDDLGVDDVRLRYRDVGMA